MLRMKVLLWCLWTWILKTQHGSCDIPKGCPFPTCICWESKVLCKNRGKQLPYIPPLPNGTQFLEFSGNVLVEISKETLKNISHLNLKELTLKGNEISNITRDAFQLYPELSLLDLSNNSIPTQVLCNAFFGLKNSNLSTLRLSRLNITAIPGNCFVHLDNTKLEKIYLSENVLKSLKGTPFSSLKYLQVVNASFNHLSRFALKGFQNLTELWASNNNFLTIPGMANKSGHCYSAHLKTLDLSVNSIPSLEPKYFPKNCTKQLTRLFFHQNRIRRIYSNTFSEIQNLKYLSLSYIDNKVEIQNDAFNIRTLQVLYFWNKIDFGNTKRINATNLFQKCPNLVTLSLLQNRLSGLSMQTIYEMLSPLTKLITLSLQKTDLYSLPLRLFSKFHQLKKLNLKNNKISSWHPDVFANVTSLETLYVDRNRITVINESSFPEILRRHLKKIDVSYNPFACTCQLVWFRKWMHDIRQSSMDLPNFPEHYECYSPRELTRTLLIDYNPTYADCHPLSPYIILGIVLGIIAVITLVSGTIAYKYRWHVKYWIYLMRSRKGYQKIPGDDYQYDAFVAYNAADREWVIRKMMPFLEAQNQIKLCLHERDFEPGRWIIDNIIENMKDSRKIILVLSNNFAKSQWCQFETVMAQERMFENNTDSLILVMLEDVKAKHMTNILHMLMKSTTYIAWTNEKTGQELFWNKLRDVLMRPV